MAYVPPQDTVYQFHIAPSLLKLPPVRLSVEDEPIHIVGGFADAEVGTTDNVLTVTVVLTQVVVLHVPSALT